MRLSIIVKGCNHSKNHDHDQQSKMNYFLWGVMGRTTVSIKYKNKRVTKFNKELNFFRSIKKVSKLLNECTYREVEATRKITKAGLKKGLAPSGYSLCYSGNDYVHT